MLGMLDDVEWRQIRAAFIRARGTRTQGAIAKAGGLYQSDISKLEANDNLGPAVGTFIKAIEGLGISVSSFFAEIEHGHESGIAAAGGSPRDRAVQAVASAPPDLEALGAALVRIVHDAVAREQTAAPRPTRSRAGKGRRANR